MLNGEKAEKIYRGLLYIVFFAYFVWACCFIYKSSFVVYTGVRYFSLFDDAMISMKYAHNFSHGKGLVWNVGEHVEGYTNFLWVLYMALITLIFSKPIAVLVVQITGIIIVMSVALLSTKFTELPGLSTIPNTYRNKFLLAALVLSYYPLSYWSLMGMETGLLTMLVTLIAYLLFADIKDLKYTTLQTVGILCVLAYLTRPDFLYMVGIIVAWIFYIKPTKITVFNIFKCILIPLFLILFTHTMYRLDYYGDFLPNTVRLKVFGLSMPLRIKSGIGFTQYFILESLLYILLVTLSIFWRNKSLILLSVMFVTTILYQVYVGGDPWDYWRVFVVVMPLVMVLSLSTLNNFLSSIVKNEHVRRILFIAIYVGLIIAPNKKFISQTTFKILPYQVESNKANTEYALMLNEFASHDTRVGIVWAGTISYYSDLYFIDFLGKTDKHIARMQSHSSPRWLGMTSVPGHNKYDLRYSIYAKQADIVQIANWDGDNLWHDPEFPFTKMSYKGHEFIVRKDFNKFRIN